MEANVISRHQSHQPFRSDRLGEMPQSELLKGSRQGDFTLSPMLVFYEVTRACDLVCQHCRACAQSDADPAELTPKQSRQLVDELVRFPEPPMLVLTGGDPLKRSDIFHLIEYATRSGLEVSITPSATPLVTPDAVRRLRDAGIARMAISIDGADADTHDALRGVPGSFARSLEILETARELGLSTQVNTTLSPENLGQVSALADLLTGAGIVMWSVFFLVPVGRARYLPRLSAEQCEAAFSCLWQEAQRRPFAIKTTEAPHYRRYAIQQLSAKNIRNHGIGSQRVAVPGRVNDGKGVLFVSHRGAIHPSGFLPVLCGTFPRDSIVDTYQNSTVFRTLRDASLLEGKCHDCEYRQLCGGSRARAHAVTGNMLAQEPDCIYVPSTYEPTLCSQKGSNPQAERV